MLKVNFDQAIPSKISFGYKNNNNMDQKTDIKTDLSPSSPLVRPTLSHIKANMLSFKGMQDRDSDMQHFFTTPDTGIRLKDVGGIDQVKDIIENRILQFIKNPQKFEEQGAKISKGVLLYGPPGTGKTHLAKAIAGEAHVPFIPCAGSDFDQEFVGVGANRVRELFNYAREVAGGRDDRTAIIFIDEFDAIAKSRDGSHGNDNRQTINALLAEMDGLKGNKDESGKPVNIIVLAATNRLEDLDKAAIREGRFDYKLEVPNPASSTAAREAILDIHSRNKKFKSEEDKKDILKEAAIMTKGYSGAQIAELMNRAATYTALRNENKNITINDLVEANLEILAGPITPNDSALWKKAGTVRHEAGHAIVGQVLLDMVNSEEETLKAGNKASEGKPWAKPKENGTIVLDSRGGFLGAVFTNDGENCTVSFDSLIANSAMTYAGACVEKLYHGTNLAGVSQDLEQGSKMISHGVTEIGLGPNTKFLAPAKDKFVEKATTPETEKDIKLMSETAVKVSKMVVEFHKDFIDKYTDTYKEKAGQGGNNLSGKAFADMLHSWQKDSGKEKEIKLMQKKIRILIDEAKQGKSINDTDLDIKAKRELGYFEIPAK